MKKAADSNWSISGKHIKEFVSGPLSESLRQAVIIAMIESEYPKKTGKTSCVTISDDELRVTLTLCYELKKGTKQ